MPSIHFNYGSWWQWLPRDEGGYPNQKVFFSGHERIIYVSEGVTDIDVKADLYSGWKEWATHSDELPEPMNWVKAFSVVGGDPISDNVDLGTTFFLENGWRIQPFPSKTPYTLSIRGNIYTREPGETINLFAEGVSVSLERSNIVETITVESLSAQLSPQDIADISIAVADQVWDEELLQHTTAGTTGKKLKDNLTQTKYIARI
jgi:hypothetical protein